MSERQEDVLETHSGRRRKQVAWQIRSLVRVADSDDIEKPALVLTMREPGSVMVSSCASPVATVVLLCLASAGARRIPPGGGEEGGERGWERDRREREGMREMGRARERQATRKRPGFWSEEWAMRRHWTSQGRQRLEMTSGLRWHRAVLDLS